MKKILIIEDETTISNLYKKELEAAKFEVIVANTANEGLNLVETLKPNLILLDIMMPSVDGYTVIKKLKEKEETAKTPIIILTNLGSSEIFVQEAKRLGVQSYLLKDKISLKEMVAEVKKNLK